MKNTTKYALVGALFTLVTPLVGAQESQCYALSKETAKAISANPSKVLEIISKLVAANESCSCEIVKSAIISTEANKELVGQIVESAIVAAPKKVSLISTCALAVAPDAQAEILAVVVKHSASAGDGYSAKGGKGKGVGVVAAATGDPGPVGNPLGSPLAFPGGGAPFSPPPIGDIVPPVDEIPPASR